MKSVKQWLFNKIFKDELLSLSKSKEQFEAYKSSLSLKDIVFRKENIFKMRLFDGVTTAPTEDGDITVNSDIFEDAKLEGLGDDELLSEAKKLRDNRALPVILNHFIRNQTVLSFCTSNTEIEIIKGRAIVAGYVLLNDEINRLNAVLKQKTEKVEVFDVHEVL